MAGSTQMRQFTNTDFGLGNLYYTPFLGNKPTIPAPGANGLIDCVVNAAWYDVGYLKDKSEFKYSYVLDEFKTGTPLMFRGQVAKEVTCSLTSKYAELVMDNLKFAIGGQNVINTGGSKTVAKEEVLTVGQAGDYYYVLLDGGTVTADPGFTCKGTPLVAQTGAAVGDYIFYPATGLVVRVPTSAKWLTTEATLTTIAVYTYITIESADLQLGSSFTIESNTVAFTHLSPTSGKVIMVVLYDAMVGGNISLGFDENNYILNDVEVKGIYHEKFAQGSGANATGGFGFIRQYEKGKLTKMTNLTGVTNGEVTDLASELKGWKV